MDQNGLDGNTAVGSGKTLNAVFSTTLLTPLRCINMIEYKREDQVNYLLIKHHTMKLHVEVEDNSTYSLPQHQMDE